MCNCDLLYQEMECCLQFSDFVHTVRWVWIRFAMYLHWNCMSQSHRMGVEPNRVQCHTHQCITRRFKWTLKKQNRRRKWNPPRRPLVLQHPASFLSRHWLPLKSTSKIFQVRVQYYVIFPNLNDVIYQQSYWLICCPQTTISFRCCHCGFE